MYREIWKKYKKGFKFLLPFIVLQILFENINLRFNFTDFDFFGEGGNLIGNLSIFKQAMINEMIPILFQLFVGTLISSFLLVVIKALLNEEGVNYRENFKECISFYLRYLGLNVVITTIFIGLIFLGFWPIFIPFIIILIIYFNILLTPCEAYLIYYNTNVMGALKRGKALGKKYSGDIILLGLMVSIIIGVTIGGMSLININPTINSIIKICMDFITASVGVYFYMFVMNICKTEQKIQEEALQC